MRRPHAALQKLHCSSVGRKSRTKRWTPNSTLQFSNRPEGSHRVRTRGMFRYGVLSRSSDGITIVRLRACNLCMARPDGTARSAPNNHQEHLAQDHCRSYTEPATGSDDPESNSKMRFVATDSGIEEGHRYHCTKAFARFAPLHRLGPRTKIQGLALFLASPASTYVTGSQIVIDGGVLLGQAD